MSDTTPDTTVKDDFDAAFEEKLGRGTLRGWAMFALGAASAAVALFAEPLHASGWWTLPAVSAMIFFYASGHGFGNAAALQWIDREGWFDDEDDEGEDGE